jgi:hypothetical protein
MRSLHYLQYLVAFVAVVGGVSRLSYGESPSDSAAVHPIDFANDVQSVLRERCHKCHGGVRRQGELSLLRREDAVSVLPSGTRAIVPGDPDASELLRRVAADDPAERMPPNGDPLAEQEIALLRRWIAEGAKWDQHWSFQPLQGPQLPQLPANQTWTRNPVDHFVLNRLNAVGIQPSPEAARHTLVRRLYLDLVGLLPTVEDVEAFCRDERPDAYERIVDQLLASPHFGERWGRHWLDQARYADTDGFEVDGPRNRAWLWRDWVIRALNSDMPFDQFTLEQIAGDLLDDPTTEQRLATGFHRQSLTNREGGIDKGEARYKELVERVNAVGTIWLGLTVGCAQCHDHPYDPFTQREFYELFAFFNQSDDTDVKVNSHHPLAGRSPTLPQRGASMRELDAQVVSQSVALRATTMYRRGDFLQPGETVQPDVLSQLHPLETAADKSNLNSSLKTPDRLDLARWMIHRDNPLMPRVAANQIWIRLFGAGLVRTPDDFGVRGERPTHAELLDWLADEYRSNGWSTKRMIRQIVTSATYRQSSGHRADLLAVDPLNEQWHRQNRYRVEAELVHDLSLGAAGLLTAEIGGPSFYPPLADEVTKLSFRSNYVWKTSTGSERYRRGMYIFYKRTLPHPNLDTFDCPDANVPRMQRETSNTPLQALTTLNHDVFFEAAMALGKRAHADTEQTSGDRQRIDFLYRVCLGRLPTDREAQSCQALLQSNRDWYQENRDDAGDLVRHDGSGNVDQRELAPWVALSNVILNLDEFLTRE